ncbi:MAG: amidohydrolase [Proteobacteria bacterium]|nr:amidohydrolase [Pseudomonadota bacterium]
MSKVTVYVARRVRTMDPGRPLAQAVAVMDGKVLSTGTLESMQPWLSRHEHVIDRTLQDQVILPGLIDPHTHFSMSAGYLALVYIGPIEAPGADGMVPAADTLDDVMRTLQRAHDDEPDRSKPLVAWGLDPALHGGHLHRDMLDAISRERPIWVIAYAPHFIYVNSAALARSGVPDDTTIHGVLRYDDGRLKGVFVEIEAARAVLGGMRAEIQKGGGLAGMKRMGDTARRAGVTTTTEMVFGASDFDLEWALHDEAVNADDFPLRMGLVTLELPIFTKHGERAAAFLQEMQQRNTPKLFFKGVKYLADGSYPAMSLRLNFPGYLDGSNGLRNFVPWDDMADRMEPYWRAGLQIHCHANGDEAIDATLDALAQLQQRQPRFDHRFTLEHYCISDPMQARRLKALGGLASVNNYFTHYRSQLHSAVGYGPDRSEAVARLGSLEREGVIFALHSDFSLVVVPMHPLTAAWIAVNRIAKDGHTVVGEGERIGVDRALRAITIDAAYVLGLERQLGSLEPGKWADFAILDEDPYEVDPLRLKDIGIWGTALAGKLQPA